MRYFSCMAKNTSKPYKANLLTIALLSVIVLLVMFAEGYPLFIERWYSEGLYPIFCRVLHAIFNLFPFSLGDVFYILATGLIFYAIIRVLQLLFTRRFKQTGSLLLKIVIAVECAYLAFYLFWGLNYFRPSAARRLALTDTTYTIANVDTITALLIDSANAMRARLDTADRHQANALSYQSAVTAIEGLGKISDQFKSYSPRIKPSLLSWLMNYMGTSGYYNPFTSESQINYQMPAFDIPFVACHELSHQIGFAREDEANFVGFIAGISSNNRSLRYSAYYTGVEEFMHYIRRRDTVAHHHLRLRISPMVIHDFKTDSAYWAKYEGSTEVVSSLFYDQFLKANNQPQGLHTYNRMIRLTMAWYRRKQKDHLP